MSTLTLRPAAIAQAALLAALLAVPAGSAWSAPPKMLSTGVGKTERVAHKEFLTLFIFAEAKGPYLANIAVEIKDAQGQAVAATTSEGPWLFVALEPGDYSVVATRPGGRRSQAAFTVAGGRQQTVRLTW